MRLLKRTLVAAAIVAAALAVYPVATALLSAQSQVSSGGSFLTTQNQVLNAVWTWLGASPLKFEGATNDSVVTTITVTDPTAARTWTIPDATDTFVGKATTDVLTNKTVSGFMNTDYKVVPATIAYDSKPAAATITGMSWPVVAGATYMFDVELPTTMTTVGGLTVSFKLTTATLTSIRYSSYASTATDNATAVSTTGTTTTDATAMFDSKTAAYTHVHLWGSFVVNAAGTIAFQGTQNTSGTAGDVTSILIGAGAKLVRVL